MRIKAQVNIDGIMRDIFINCAKDLVAIKFNERDLQVISQWPNAAHPLVMGPKSFIQSNPALVNKFVTEWPMEFHASHTLPGGSILAPDGKSIIDKKGD